MRRTEGRLAWLLFATAAAAFVLQAWRFHAYLLDDTFISFRYARNWVDGLGLVFNAGDRVEGYTNFSFVALAALSLRLGLDPIPVTRLASVAAFIGSLAAAVALGRLRPARATGPANVALLMLTLPPLAYWAVASFETMPFTFLFTLALTLACFEGRSGRFRGAALVFALLALTRPEGVLFFGLTLGARALAEGMRPRAMLRDVLLFSAAYGPYFAWRTGYYGDLVPNTFHAKVTGGAEQALTGILYLGDWFTTAPFAALSLPLALALSAQRVRSRLEADPTMVTVALVLAGTTAYVVAVGGDFMPYSRFFVPLFPAASVLLVWAIDAAAARATHPWGFETACIALALGAQLVSGLLSTQPCRAFIAHRTTLVGEAVGAWFDRTLRAGDWIAVNTAGAIPYFARRPAIDTLGLTDHAIATRPVYVVSPHWAGHRRGWGRYVLDRRPRVVFWYNAAGSLEPFYLGDRELADDPVFRFFYRPRVLELPSVPRAALGEKVESFLGSPFGTAPAGRRVSQGEFGVLVESVNDPLPRTLFYEGPVRAHYFEIDERDAALWPRRAELRSAPDRLLDAAAEQWRSEIASEPPVDGGAHAEVERLCAEALERLRAGDRPSAKQLLSEAAAKNARARSPLVFQYIANLATLDGDLWMAVNAEKAALRLQPDNRLYRENLRSLLFVPYERFRRAAPQPTPQEKGSDNLSWRKAGRQLSRGEKLSDPFSGSLDPPPSSS